MINNLLKVALCLGVIYGATGLQSVHCMEIQYNQNIIENNMDDKYTTTDDNGAKYTISENIYNTTAEYLKTDFDVCNGWCQEIDKVLKNYPNKTTQAYIDVVYGRAVYLAQHMLDLIANWKISASDKLRNTAGTKNALDDLISKNNELLKDVEKDVESVQTLANETVVMKNYYEHFQKLINKITQLKKIKNEI